MVDTEGGCDVVITRKNEKTRSAVRNLSFNAFTTGNPLSGTKLLGFSIGRGFGALKGLLNARSVIGNNKRPTCLLLLTQ